MAEQGQLRQTGTRQKTLSATVAELAHFVATPPIQELHFNTCGLMMCCQTGVSAPRAVENGGFWPIAFAVLCLSFKLGHDSV
jgi:hypothetical protein